jgi:hypothetical protein
MRSKQEMFDTVWNHFVVNKGPMSAAMIGDPDMKPGVNNGVKCYYRGPNGARCAAGLFIDDETYHASMEQTTVDCLRNPDDASLPLFPHVMSVFLYQLQLCHDNAARDALLGVRDFHEGIERRLRDRIETGRITGVSVPAAD